MIEQGYALTAILIVAAVTGLTRAIPYLIFSGKQELPASVRYLAAMLPASIMIILVAYCLRNTEFVAYPYGLPEAISVLFVIYLQIWKKNTLLSIFLGTACYMFLIRLVFTA